MAASLTHDQSETESEDKDEETTYNRDDLLAENPFNLRNFSSKKLWYMALFDVEHWVSELKDFTFPTVFTDVDCLEAVAIDHFHREGCCGQIKKITEADHKALALLRNKIDLLFSQFPPCTKFFIRLGPRSPKDAPVMASNVRSDVGFSDSDLREVLESYSRNLVIHEGNNEEDACEILRRFQDVSSGLLRVSSSQQALRLLVSSSRVFQDISRTLDLGEARWQMSLVIREWDDDVRLEREFRTFVVAGDVVAICQYDEQLVYPFVTTSNHDELIVGAILSCMQSAKPKFEALGLASIRTPVVVDFLVVPPCQHLDSWQARIVELNPFGPMTGSAFFHWTFERRILQGGQDIFGDLDEWEAKYPTGSTTLPPHIREHVILGVPFRYNVQNKPGFTMDQLSAYWYDYERLSPPGMRAKAG